MAKVSIIVPCWGVEKYLDRCVESLVNQTLQDIEIILVDDESPDRVPEMCDDWAKKDRRIKVIHKKNGGLGLACNSGIEVATGEYLAFCDSDDWVDAKMYETMYEASERYSADVIYTGLKRVNIDGLEIGRLSHFNDLRVFNGRTEVDQLLRDMISPAPSVKEERLIQVSAKVVLYRHRIIEENSIRFVSEREYPSEDLIFNIDYLAHSNIACVLPSYFYNYQVTPNSITTKIKPNHFKSINNTYDYIVCLCRKYSVKSYELVCERFYIGYCRAYIAEILTAKIERSLQRNLLYEVIDSPKCQTIIKNYPITSMSIPKQIFTYAMRYHSTTVLAILSKLRNR